jgi:hypothetical protein
LHPATLLWRRHPGFLHITLHFRRNWEGDRGIWRLTKGICSRRKERWLALNTWLELDIACERLLLLGLFFDFITFRAGHAVIFLFGETHCETVLSWTYELGYGNNCTTASEIFGRGLIL